MRVATVIILSASEKKILEKNARNRNVSIILSERSKIVLLSAEVMKNKVIAGKLNIAPNKVGKWRNRFGQGGIARRSAKINKEGKTMEEKIH